MFPYDLRFKQNLFLLLFLFCADPLWSLRTQNWLSDLNDALELSRKKKQPLLLDIYAPWCKYCRKLQEKVYPSKKVREFSQKFIRVRINGEKRRGLMERYGARAFPSIVLLDSKGLRLDTIHGFITASPLRRRLKKAYWRSLRYQSIFDKLKESPHSPHWNYKAGNYYFEIGDYTEAHEHFVRAWKSSAKSSLGAKSKLVGKIKDRAKGNSRQALYNAAVCSMHVDDYAGAVHKWNLYLGHYPMKGKEYVYARYYRGLSYFYQGKKKTSRPDLAYAKKHMGASEESRNAALLLQNIP